MHSKHSTGSITKECAVAPVPSHCILGINVGEHRDTASRQVGTTVTLWQIQPGNGFVRTFTTATFLPTDGSTISVGGEYANVLEGWWFSRLQNPQTKTGGGVKAHRLSQQIGSQLPERAGIPVNTIVKNTIVPSTT